MPHDWASEKAEQLIANGPICDVVALSAVLREVRNLALQEALLLCSAAAIKLGPRVIESSDYAVTTANELSRCAARIERLIFSNY